MGGGRKKERWDDEGRQVGRDEMWRKGEREGGMGERGEMEGG